MDLALFVYGSLMPGASNWKRYCEHRVAELQPARVRGRLYQLSDGYLALALPGAPDSGLETRNPKPEPLPWVRGWRLVLRSEAALREIDRLEDFDPARPLAENVYLRTRLECFADGAPPPASLGEAWVYTMTAARLAHEGAVELPQP